MRRIASLLIIACAGTIFACAIPAYAQQGGNGQEQQDQDAKTRKRNEEWGTDNKNLALPQLRNAGPCPTVKILYDAARYVELKDGREAPDAVGFTGEMENLTSACEYKGAEPVTVQARVLFELGRGPQAAGSEKTYRYWVAVTDRNKAVLEKAYFDLPVSFPAGRDRVQTTQDITRIVIPRANSTVSGGNFEVLVGFDVTPEMADFNRQGKRFMANAGVSGRP
jgi:hypothetical protein